MSEQVKPDVLSSLGIDPQKFADYARGCSSEYSFPTACGTETAHCQLHGEHKRHKAIFHGFPMEWEDVQ